MPTAIKTPLKDILPVIKCIPTFQQCQSF